MNTQLIDSLVRIILSLSEEERELLNRKIESEQRENLQINAQILDLENRVKQYENQYRMSSEEFYPRFRSGELGDAMDYGSSVCVMQWTEVIRDGTLIEKGI
ncbi:MAG: hypothetical protein O9326_00720 [Microcystis sp. LE19-338.1B]|jgi:hypothetical protein|nr:hypothetical protein [Microcystis sp. LE19-338.1B]MCZ8356689.1 hypothetical protein [Microcystis sp. LE19-388.1G]